MRPSGIVNVTRHAPDGSVVESYRRLAGTKIKVPNDFTIEQGSPFMTDDIAKAAKINTAFRRTFESNATLQLLQANAAARQPKPKPWYRRAWFKVADLIGRVPDAWAVLRGRARIETEDW